jgi:hypothetical protein
MTHEVEMDEFHALLTRLDRLHGDADYAILVPWTYTDFHYLRFAYPDRLAYSVQSKTAHRYQPGEREAFEQRYYGKRIVRTVDELLALDVPLIYVGFELNFSVANLRRMTLRLPNDPLGKYFEEKKFQNHLALSWMWNDPAIVLSNRTVLGHYIAYDVRFNKSAQSPTRVSRAAKQHKPLHTP